MSKISTTDPRLNSHEIQAIIQKVEPGLYNVNDRPIQSPEQRSADFKTILKTFQREISQPFKEQRQIVNDLDDTKKFVWDNSIKDLIQGIGDSIVNQLDCTMTKILHTFHPEMYQNPPGPPNNNPHGHPITTLKGGIGSGLGRCGEVLEVICKDLSKKGSLTLQNFRDHIWAGMNFIDKLATLINQDDRILFQAKFDKNSLQNFTIDKSKVDFTGSYKTEFKKLATKARAEGGGCPARKILVKIAPVQEHHKGLKIVNLVKATYWLLAKRVEAELFKKDAS